MGPYRPVHVKTLHSQKLRMLLAHRKLLQSKAIAIQNDLGGTLRNFGLGGTLRNFGLKVGMALDPDRPIKADIGRPLHDLRLNSQSTTFSELV